MNRVTSSYFQSNYQRLDDPVVVMARSRKLGTWYPKGTEPSASPPVPLRADTASEAAGSGRVSTLATAPTGDSTR